MQKIARILTIYYFIADYALHINKYMRKYINLNWHSLIYAKLPIRLIYIDYNINRIYN